MRYINTSEQLKNAFFGLIGPVNDSIKKKAIKPECLEVLINNDRSELMGLDVDRIVIKVSLDSNNQFDFKKAWLDVPSIEVLNERFPDGFNVVAVLNLDRRREE